VSIELLELEGLLAAGLALEGAIESTVMSATKLGSMTSADKVSFPI